jgi:hypothetical protein
LQVGNMSYPIKYPTPQGANVQIFNCISYDEFKYQTWIKPQGASMVWFTLIGAGGGGGGTDGVTTFFGGGSGAVTNLMIPAFLVPDNLSVNVGSGGAFGGAGGGFASAGIGTKISTILNGNVSNLLVAEGGAGGDDTSASGAGSMTANFFTAAGLFQSVAGQAGVTGTNGASSTTFLSGGGATGSQTANYGYNNGGANGGVGYFQMSPIIVGVGGNARSSGTGTYVGGIGCGGGGSSNATGTPMAGSPGGNGLAVIITW